MSASHPVPATTLEQNKQLLVRWFDEVWSRGHRDTICAMLAPDCVLYDGARPIRGPAEFEQFYDDLRAQFSNFRIVPVAVLAEGDLVCMHWSCSSTHNASGKNTAITGTSVVRVKDGRFIEAWQNWDQAGLAAQLAST
jgi:predicted SnoaL-like aldol condensation-catalyzing enzyme